VSAALDALDRELRGFRRRLRESAPAWFAVGAPPFATRGELAFHVVRRTAATGFGIEWPGRALPDLPRLPDLSLADQLDVVATDLLAVASGDESAVARLLGELLVHRQQLDGAAPGPAATALVAELTGLADPADWAAFCDAVAR
jgi:hypothetical protein